MPNNKMTCGCVGCFGTIIVLAAIIGISNQYPQSKSTSQKQKEANSPGRKQANKANQTPDSTDNVRRINFPHVGFREAGMVDGVEYVAVSHRKTYSIGDGFTKTSADGVFIMVGLAALNQTKETHTISTSLINLVDEKDREYSPSSAGMTAASMAGVSAAEPISAEVQPGVEKLVMLVYDVPIKDKNFKIKIPAGTFSLDHDATIKVY